MDHYKTIKLCIDTLAYLTKAQNQAKKLNSPMADVLNQRIKTAISLINYIYEYHRQHPKNPIKRP